MSQVLHLLVPESTFPRMQLQHGFPQGFEKLPQVGQVIGPRVAADNNVVDVSYRKDPLHTVQEHVHHSLEDGGTRGEPERQSAVLALAIGRYETGLWSVLLLDFYLVKPVMSMTE